jgi:mannosyltransferase OCH1-like enzyme
MTPKIIHCVWLGGAEKPPVVRKCMESWRRFCPGWEVREWGDADMARVSNRYAREAYGRRKWAFASDYLRLKALNDFGGVEINK